MTKHSNPTAGIRPKTRKLQPLQVPDALPRINTLARASGIVVRETLNASIQRKPRVRHQQPLHVLQLPDALLRMTTLAQASGLSVATLYRKVAAGELELVKIGLRCTRVRASVAREFIQTQGQPVSTATVAATVSAPAAAPRPAKVHDKRAAFEAAKAALGARGGTK